MNNVMQTRVASVLIAAVGIWLLVSPLFIATTGGALISTLAVGGVLGLAGIVQFFWENAIPSWVSGLAAAWLAVSAVVFSMDSALLWSTGLAAAATFLLALWDGIEVDQVAQEHAHVH